MTKTLIFLIIYLLCNTSNAFEWVESHIGGGMVMQENIRRNNKKWWFKDDPRYQPIPLFLLRFGPWFVDRNGAGMGVIYTDNIRLLGVITYRGEPYKTRGIAERKRSFYAGGIFKFYAFEFKYYQDLEGISKGNILKAYYAPRFGQEKEGYYFTPRLYAEHWNNKYTNYYFGVPNHEATAAGMRNYEAKRAINWGYELRNVWQYGTFRYFASAGMKYYDKTVRNSPTVVKGNEYLFFVGLLWKVY